jgi:hypothetical protein
MSVLVFALLACAFGSGGDERKDGWASASRVARTRALAGGAGMGSVGGRHGWQVANWEGDRSSSSGLMVSLKRSTGGSSGWSLVEMRKGNGKGEGENEANGRGE